MMRGARFADREYEIQGLFELPKPPTTPPVCGPGATTTPGGLLSDMREAFLAIPGMDAMKSGPALTEHPAPGDARRSRYGRWPRAVAATLLPHAAMDPAALVMASASRRRPASQPVTPVTHLHSLTRRVADTSDAQPTQATSNPSVTLLLSCP